MQISNSSGRVLIIIMHCLLVEPLPRFKANNIERTRLMEVFAQSIKEKRCPAMPSIKYLLSVDDVLSHLHAEHVKGWINYQIKKVRQAEQ